LVTLNYGIQIARLLGDAFDRTLMLTGNHDQFYKDSRAIHSIEWAQHVNNIEIINDWHEEGNCLLIPWMVKDEHKKVARSKGKYCFGHLELAHFMMNAQVVMPDVHPLKHAHFSGFEKVFSGHFHKRQQQGNIYYIGNTFPHNFSDAWDDDRGMMVLEWDKEPEFHAWPGAPRYRTVKLSDLTTDTAKYLHKNSFVKILVDAEVSYEELNYLKESLVEEYELREVSIVPMKNDEHKEETMTDVSFKSVNEIVYESVANIDSEFYDKNLLMEIYKNLA
jgi:DNA repair exonuclease SbcCD nuclease subunit